MVVTQQLLCPVVLAVVVMDSYRQQRAVQLHHLDKVMRGVMDTLIRVSPVAAVVVQGRLVKVIKMIQILVVLVCQTALVDQRCFTLAAAVAQMD